MELHLRLSPPQPGRISISVVDHSQEPLFPGTIVVVVSKFITACYVSKLLPVLSFLHISRLGWRFVKREDCWTAAELGATTLCLATPDLQYPQSSSRASPPTGPAESQFRFSFTCTAITIIHRYLSLTHSRWIAQRAPRTRASSQLDG